MSTKYSPTLGAEYYEFWEENELFEPTNAKTDKNFCIMMPPPNVTGSLHIGHALTFTLQDIITRYKRMDGYNTLWQPGTDHASIAVENILEKQLLEKNTTKEQIGKEAFLDLAWKWKEKSGGDIVNQLRRLGISAAWRKERFTMDAGLNKAVKKAFVQMYNEGNIFKGNYLINWCVKCGALSDIEVDFLETNGALYYIKYALKDSNDFLVVATTRPETYFGDTAIMVNPKDLRHKHLVGKTAILPLIGKEIPIIADEFVDMEFGSGIVKVTPAHDTNDYDVGKRHNLEFISVFDEKGILNEHCAQFQGLDVKTARLKVVEALQENGFIEKIEPHKHQVGHCYRCGGVIEPFISQQWFVKASVAKKAIDLVAQNKTKFFPQSWKNNYNAWMKDLRDWCISRQLYWGHKIPVFYCKDCEHEFASEKTAPTCPKCGGATIQDENVLDTWFSSALWPFSTLGWGNEDEPKVGKNDLANFYPNSLLITGFDILFFWVARMLMFGAHFLNQVPFKDVYLHALVRDEHGQKMSKSKGNVINPLEIINEMGADTLRFTLAALAIQGRDIKLAKEHLTQYRNFANKIYNAKNYLCQNQKGFADLGNIKLETKLGMYIFSRFNKAILDLRQALDNYRFNDAALVLYKFFWNEFCDWGIELSKADPKSVVELGSIFKEALKLLHPFMPFLTESLYQELNQSSLSKQTSIMLKDFPKSAQQDLNLEADFELIIEAISSIRRAKINMNMPNKAVQKALVLCPKLTFGLNFVQKLAKVESVEIISKKPEISCISDVSNSLESYIPIQKADTKELSQRLNLQIQKAQKEEEKLSSMLNNDNFVKNAPQNVVEANSQKLAEIKDLIKRLQVELLAIS